MLVTRGLHIVAMQESHEHVSSHIDVPGFHWFGRPCVGRSKGGASFLVALASVSEVEVLGSVLNPESVWLCVQGRRGQRELLLGATFCCPGGRETL